MGLVYTSRAISMPFDGCCERPRPMPSTRRPAALASAFTFVLLALAALVAPLPGGTGTAFAADSADAQIDFGVEMARRGLWSEALFRFKQAERLEPASFRVYNNLAVAYEANGLFDQALAYYQKALKIEPSNRELRRNYSRFIEFYQSFRPRDEKEKSADGSGGTTGGGDSGNQGGKPPAGG